MLRSMLPVLAGILVAFAALILYNQLSAPPEPLTLDHIEESVADMLAEATPAPALSTQVYEIILPSLVAIRINDFGPPGDSSTRMSGQGEYLPSDRDLTTLIANRSATYADISNLTVGNRTIPNIQTQNQQSYAVGSGVIINDSGAILTAYHVVERATTLDVTFADGTEARAAIVAVEPDNDIAVLQADALPELFAAATLGNPGALRIGDEAYAVGNPLGLAGSISAGVISGLDRTYTRTAGQPPLQRLIQFDAAVNMGSAGGPLLNRNGQVVGIVVGPINPNAQETFIGIGFAVRIDVAGTAAGVPEQ